MASPLCWKQCDINGILYRPVGSIGKLQVVEWVSDGFEVGQHKALKRLNYYRGQCDRSAVINSCGSLKEAAGCGFLLSVSHTLSWLSKSQFEMSQACAELMTGNLCTVQLVIFQSDLILTCSDVMQM